VVDWSELFSAGGNEGMVGAVSTETDDAGIGLTSIFSSRLTTSLNLLYLTPLPSPRAITLLFHPLHPLSLHSHLHWIIVPHS
jgi:hypothetical protein